MAKLGNEVIARKSDTSISIAMTDYYTFLSRRDYLNGLRSGFTGEIEDLGNLYKDWQVPIDDPKVDYEFLFEWERENCTERSLAEIHQTDKWLFANERLQWMLPVNDEWKMKVLEDSIRWCQDYMIRVRPSVLVAVNNNTLIINILYTLAQKNNIPFFSFISTRIGNRKILTRGIGYGTSTSLKEKLETDVPLGDLPLAIRPFLESFMVERTGSYSSTTNLLQKNLEDRRKRKLRYLFGEIRLLFGRVYARAFIQKKERAFKCVRIQENFWKMSLVELRSIITYGIRLLGIKLFGRTSLPNEKYIAWALHYRPEGAILALGDGRDELLELFKCADLMPDGFFIAVKENPDMFGIRRPGFYSKLKSHPRIILIDPFFSSFELIAGSIGAMGISGTLLLEAALLNKPSCALGHPEFDSFLTSSGWDNAAVFIEKCIQKTYPSPLLKIAPYIEYVLENCDQSDVSFGADLSSIDTINMVKRFAEQLLIELQNF